jgi:hypothetical protein
MSKTKVAGGVITNGIYRPYGQAHKNFARNGAPKRLTVPALATGMHRATQGELHPYLHGQAVDDETADKLCHGKGNVPAHPGMKQSYHGAVSTSGYSTRLAEETPGQSDRVLQEAGRMGAPVGGWKR